MGLEIALGLLLVLALAQTAGLVVLWRRDRLRHAALTRVLEKLSQQMLHGCTDVPTSMLVTALGRLERRVAAMELPPAATARPSYDLAQQLAREGADAQQLMERCGLSRDEANLIVQMHAASH